MMHLPELHLESARHIGVIRRLNGVNLSPAVGDSYVAAYAELNAACARMHDASLNCAGRELIDISRIFPLFHLDHHDPKNYWFKETDGYLKQCIDTGTPVYYRLGESIEPHPVKYRVNPPADFQKWAEICEHIIAHYNEGWADGFHFGIEYWEIWNEPDTTSMWTGYCADGLEDAAPGAVQCGRIIVTAWTVQLNNRIDLHIDRRGLLVMLLKRIGGLPARAVSDADAGFWYGSLGKGKLLAAANLAYDPWPECVLELERIPVRIEQLQGDGSWKTVPFTASGNRITVPVRLECAQIAVFRTAEGCPE